MLKVLSSIFLSLFLGTVAFATDETYILSLEKNPFKSCKGTGNSSSSRYAGMDLTVLFQKSSIRVRDNATGKTIDYASTKKLCGIDIARTVPICSDQTEEFYPGSNYSYSKKNCRISIPGTSRNLYNLRLNFFVNFTEVNGHLASGGVLACVVNEDGFHGITLRECEK